MSSVSRFGDHSINSQSSREELITLIKENKEVKKQLERNISNYLMLSKKITDDNSISFYVLTDTSEGTLKYIQSIQKICAEKFLPFPSWEKHPVLLSEKDVQAMNFSHVIKILKESLQLPSEGACFKNEDLFETSKLLDDLFKEALQNYAKALYESAENDHYTIHEKTKLSNKAAIMNRNSYSRLKCLHEIDTKEKERKKNSAELIKVRCEVLYDDLQELEEGVVDTKKIKEMDQLIKIQGYITDNQFIPIGKTTVKQYLKKNNIFTQE